MDIDLAKRVSPKFVATMKISRFSLCPLAQGKNLELSINESYSRVIKEEFHQTLQ